MEQGEQHPTDLMNAYNTGLKAGDSYWATSYRNFVEEESANQDDDFYFINSEMVMWQTERNACKNTGTNRIIDEMVKYDWKAISGVGDDHDKWQNWCDGFADAIIKHLDNMLSVR